MRTLFETCARIATALLLASLCGAASADYTITFDNLVGANESPMPSPYTENGWVVTPLEGLWFQGQIFGNPEPSIFAGPIGQVTPGFNIIQVTQESHGLFKFESVDLACNNGTDCPFAFQGSLGGGILFTDFPGSVPAGPPFAFFTELSTNTSYIDSLLIAIAPGDGTTSMNIDNIRVPEPGILALLAVGFMGMGFAARRRRS